MAFRSCLCTANLRSLILLGTAIAFALISTATSHAQVRAVRITPSAGRVIVQSSPLASPTFIKNGVVGESAQGAVNSVGPTKTPGAKPANEAASDTPATQSLDEKRIKRLMAAKFDRTPAGILKAWKVEATKKIEAKRERATEESNPIEATIANVFKGFVVMEVNDVARIKPNQVIALHRKPVGTDELGESINAKAPRAPVAKMKVLSIDGKDVSGKLMPQSVPAPKVDAKPVGGQSDSSGKLDSGAKPAADQAGSATKRPEGQSAETKLAPDVDPKTKAETASPKSASQEDQDGRSAANEADEAAPVTPKDTGPLAEAAKSPAEADAVRGNPVASPTSEAKVDPAFKASQRTQDPVAAGANPQIAAGDLFRVTLMEPANTAASNSEDEQVAAEVEAFTRNVTLGKWDLVKQYLGQLKDKDQADQVYERILKALVVAMPDVPPNQASQRQSQMRQRGETLPSSYLTPDDILALTEASPKLISIIDPEEDEQEAASVAANVPPNGVPVAGGPVAPGSIAPNVVMSTSVPIALPSGTPVTPQLMAALANANAASVQPNVAPAAVPSTQQPKPQKPSRHLNSIAQLIRKSRDAGHDFNGFISRLQTGTTFFGGQDLTKRMTTASLLMSAGMYEQADAFLPPEDPQTLADPNHQMVLLRLWAQFSRQRYATEKVAKWLNRSWEISQKILDHPNAKEADKTTALTRLIELSTVVEAEVGQTWLQESFTKSTARGKAILANLGSQSADLARKAAQVSDIQRIKMLRMQNKAVESFLDLTSEIPADMRATLTLLAQNWITEANISVKNSTQTSRGGYMSIDMYGNYYWTDPNSNRSSGSRRQRPIKIGDILEIVPSQNWLIHVSPTLLTEVSKAQANLHLRINEEDQAFPFIEKLAETHPEIARDLVHEFLKIWTRNHDPNTDRRQRNPYIYMYGFDQKAESIPLTRSKQERNLKELTDWVARIRKMPIEDVDEKLLASAFTTCHSTAEVYRLDRVKSVFGDLTQLEPDTIAELAQTMRGNLTSVWRQVKVQEAKQTKRKLPEVQQEVLRGYGTAMALVEEALGASPENYKLHLAKACIMYDQNAYAQSVKKSSEFSDKRDAAFEQFAISAKHYISKSPQLDEQKQSTDVFDRWFYAALGAVDLGQIKAENQPDQRQFAKIRTAIESLPGELSGEHMGKFANNLFTRMSPIKPELKFRYLKGGFEIVGDHPRAWEAKNLYDYYKDLVTEIQLNVEIDGDDNVGTDPFGVYVSLKHTPEIEREAGGFGKYVQNQNNMMFAFNYGRPTEDYRDKFRDGVDQALGEHFEVISTTFESADRMKSRPTVDGMRITPYAYVMLKAKGTEVDRIAPMKLDLDFLDTSGYVVIPIESPALVIDASGEASMRPISDLKITNTLDERQSKEGKLICEISASGKGLIPDLEEIVDVEVEDFEIVSVDDQGALPTTFDEEGDEVQILSDRSWTIEYKARDSAQAVNQFSFPKPIRENVEIKFLRYEDADLVAAEPVMALQATYSSSRSPIWYWLAPLGALVLIGFGLVIWLAQPKEQMATRSFEVPQDVNPFTVLSLLKEIKHRNGISPQQEGELDQSINRIESFYFGEQAEEGPGDLEDVARTWVAKARPR